MLCPSCKSELSGSARFCPNCGQPADSNAATLVDDDAGMGGETFAPPSPAPKPPSSPPRSAGAARSPSGSARTPSSSGALGGARFTPGQIIAERYRIVALLGRGGMGEVYRAEDLKLSQLVAVKFLPMSLSQDAGALARFHSEVRIARQVSHPNVCRVFDIGDADGVPFLSMEFVDGEDLASLIRRIGRLSPDKAIEIARQTCAGLAAAHERGVIHRDLKPANLMLDGSGKIRITDFGLASVAASLEGADARAGTPAYMAPEQLEGREVTAKSDLYSLGLVLYEILTGKRVYDATTLPELMRQREKTTPASPSTLVRDLDPLIERVILRCLENDPVRRPGSALQVAAALPGGDPLAAALAAGETPSPEMVAAAGSTEGLRPAVAMTLLAVSVAALIVLLFAADRFRLHNIAPLDNPPEVLATRAREMVKEFGYVQPYSDEAFAFSLDTAYLQYLQDHDKAPSRWERLKRGRPPTVAFWYRQSPRGLVARDFVSSIGGPITRSDPPMEISGMVLVTLDMQGRLLRLEAVPPQKDAVSADYAQAIPDWTSLFGAAGLSHSDYISVPPEWTPLAWGDARSAWRRKAADSLDMPERVEGAMYRGRPIYFDLIYPWTAAERAASLSQGARAGISTVILLTLFVGLVSSGLYVARRNILLKRSDSRGAVRLGVLVFVTVLLIWALGGHHVVSLDEFISILIALGWALLLTALGTLLYLALEPYVRRRDPHTLIAWTRLLSGQWRDPLVGRDVLIGACYGVLFSLLESSDNIILPLFRKLPPVPGGLDLTSLLGVRPAISALLFYVLAFLLYALLIFFFLFLLGLTFKRDWIGAVILVLVAAGVNWGGEYPLFTFAFFLLIWTSIVVVLKKFGLLALITGLVVQNVLVIFPTTSHFTRWYATAGLTGIIVILGVALYGFYTSLAGKPLFSMAALDR